MKDQYTYRSKAVGYSNVGKVLPILNLYVTRSKYKVKMNVIRLAKSVTGKQNGRVVFRKHTRNMKV